jgi:hypothetical protein
VELAAEIQERVAAGRPLQHPLQHYGEAAIISLAFRARQLRPIMLSDDYDARIAAKAFDLQSVSVHKLIHLMIKQLKVTAEDAFRFADALNKAGRAQITRWKNSYRNDSVVWVSLNASRPLLRRPVSCNQRT